MTTEVTTPQQVQAPAQVAPDSPRDARTGGAYADPQDALRFLGKRFDSWSLALSDRSLQLSYALVAANWAVFGSQDKILDSTFAKISLGLIVLYLALNLLLTRFIVWLLRRRFAYAEDDHVRWEAEYHEAIGKNDPWPSTKAIDGTSRVLREIRTWVPIGAGIAFIIAFL